MSSEQMVLLEEALSGKVVALQRLMLENFERLSNFLIPRIPSQLRPVCDVEDILQVTFVQVYKDFAGFRGNTVAAFYSWLQTIAEAKLVDAIRTATRQKRGGEFRRIEKAIPDASQSYLNLLEQLDGDDRSPSQSVAAHDAIEAIQIAIAALPEDQRDAITLRYVRNLALTDVAEQMKKSEDAVRGLLHRGKSMLKKTMGNSSAWFTKHG